MEDLVASITAMSVARMRAIHTRDDPQPVLRDCWGEQLVPASLLVKAIAGRSTPVGDDFEGASEAELSDLVDNYLRASPAYTNVVLRARFTEDALRDAVARGVRQYVLIGAGFDSYVLRIPPEAGDLTVIELDHPATQALKLQRIGDCGAVPGDNVQFVATDLAVEELAAALARSGYRSDVPAFFAWLGVTMYLTREANLATLRSIAGCAAPGSELVFSYIDQRMFDPEGADEAAQFDELENAVKSFGEPFVSGFHPASLARELHEVGLKLHEDLGEFEMAQRYDPQGINGFKPLDRSHVALARVSGAVSAPKDDRRDAL